MDAKTLTDQSVQAECECVVAQAERCLKAASAVRAAADDYLVRAEVEARVWSDMDRRVFEARVADLKASLKSGRAPMFYATPLKPEDVASRAEAIAALEAARQVAAELAQEEVAARRYLECASAHLRAPLAPLATEG